MSDQRRGRRADRGSRRVPRRRCAGRSTPRSRSRSRRCISRCARSWTPTHRTTPAFFARSTSRRRSAVSSTHGRPAAVAARGISGFRLIDAMFGALAQAMPERVRAAGEGGTTSYSFACYDDEGRFSLFREAVMGAWGAGFRREGIDGIANGAATSATRRSRWSRTRLRSASSTTSSCRTAADRASGAAACRCRASCAFSASARRCSCARTAAAIRRTGSWAAIRHALEQHCSTTTARWSQLPTKFMRPLSTGQAVRHTTAGAGGYGDPLAPRSRAGARRRAQRQGDCRTAQRATTVSSCCPRRGAWTSARRRRCGRNASTMSSVRVGVDIGGTFTDLVFVRRTARSTGARGPRRPTTIRRRSSRASCDYCKEREPRRAT